ncbi:MAG TPA: ROK family protein [Ramlibacter sp.]|nr:ROK family protein [Ramlibacter sp.]
MRTLRILAIDIGGSHLKASVVDAQGRMLAQKVEVNTPHPCPPHVMVDALVTLVQPLPTHDRISIGFPGVVRDGRVITAPHWVTKEWADFELPKELSRRLHGASARMINDAEMQGLAVIKGKGLELVLTLGTGAGTGLFRDGDVMPHLELAHHPIRGDKTYDDYVGDAALKKAGVKRWNRRVGRTIGILYALLHFDHLFIGGGNAVNVSIQLPDNVTLVSNDAGVEGGAMLWRRNRPNR